MNAQLIQKLGYGGTLRRAIHPEIRVIDEKTGIVEYIATDESLDSYNEIVKASGARFNRFQKNAPFVDSHNYEGIDCLVGKVLDWKIQGKRVVETAKWAIDAGLPEDHLANIGFKMTVAGYLKAVSIGFMPVQYVSKWDSNPTQFQNELALMEIAAGTDVRVIFTEWEQIELSVCIIGANPNAVAKAYKAGIISDATLEKISSEIARRKTADSTDDPADVEKAQQRVRMATMMEFKTKINRL